MCVLGKRLLKDISNAECNKTFNGTLYRIFCPNATAGCDPYFENNNVTLVQGIKGLASGVFMGKIIKYRFTALVIKLVFTYFL